MKRDTNSQAFFALLRAGLWENEVRLSQYKDIDFYAVYKLAKEQSVVGLIAAGIEHESDVKVPQNYALEFAGTALQLEQRNLAMNKFIAEMVGKMHETNIYTLLVKGQGIAQCYERPSWRAAGDIDLFLNDDDYDKAVEWFSARGSIKYDEESKYKKHVAVRINDWDIELHGTLRGELGNRIDKVIDTVQEDTFKNGHVRVWNNGVTDVIIPNADNDVIFVFTHILQHFFRGGIGLRQICDWCRLIWTYRDTLDRELLSKRLSVMGVMSEWHSFAVLAVDMLGMPEKTMPFYSPAAKWKRKSERILLYILKVGNFGQNRDIRYKEQYPYFVRFMISFHRRTDDFLRQAMVFPIDALRAYMHLWGNGFAAIYKRIIARLVSKMGTAVRHAI